MMFFEQQVYLRYTIDSEIPPVQLPLNYKIKEYDGGEGYSHSFCHIMQNAFAPEFEERIYEFSPCWLLDNHAEKIHDGIEQCYFLEFRDFPIGFTLLVHGPQDLRFVYMGILSQYQGKHLSRYLVEKSLYHAYEQSKSLVLTNTKHPGAYRVYKELGFEVFFNDEEERDYYTQLKEICTWAE
jgi:GNAT superfamily N-acetyltransferase